jgi:glycosyltransferase involved in cell wall biosynthesis
MRLRRKTAAETRGRDLNASSPLVPLAAGFRTPLDEDVTQDLAGAAPPGLAFGRGATKQQALVSVVLPVHNAAPYLRAAIESVLAQTYRLFELVIVDDGSTDGSVAIAEEYAQAHPHVRLIRNPANLGIVQARNRAFAEADPASAYFAVFDSDDICLPDRLQMQVDFLEAHPDHALVGGHTFVIDEDDGVVGARRYPVTHAEIASVITRYCPIAQPTAMIRRSALEAVGGYRDRFPRCHDYDLWLRMAARYKIANLDAFTLKYRISRTQGKRVHLRQSLKLTIELQREWLLYGPFFNPFNIAYYAAEYLLLLLPEPLVLGLFMRLTYRRARTP